MSLLHLDSAAHHNDESITRRLTAMFAQQWRRRHSDATYHYRDLTAEPITPIGNAYCELGRRVERHGLPFTGKVENLIENNAEQHEWELTSELIDELLTCNILLIGAPMYNFAISAALKAWIDRITFPSAFTNPQGKSLLTNLHVVVATACGGSYTPGTQAEKWDFLTPYLRAYFARHGVPETNIDIVTAELTLSDIVPNRNDTRPRAAETLASAQQRLTELAGTI